MKKISLLALIFKTICGLVCIALGIYYIFSGEAIQVAVFLVVGATCVVMAFVDFFKMRKEKKNKEKEDNK